MKQILLLLVAVMCLAGCSRYQMPPFSKAGEWKYQDYALINEKAKLKLDCSYSFFPNNPTNAEGECLNLITSEAAFELYNPECAKYLKDALKSIPLKIDSIEVILTDDIVVFTPSIQSEWRPDYIVQSDGSIWVEQAWPVTSLVQPHDQLWRNLIINKKKKQIITVDRFVKQGRHFAVVQIYQSELKKAPWANGTMDFTDSRNIQHMGAVLRDACERLTRAWKEDYKPKPSYNDYILQADQCFFKGDFAGASQAFSKAFSRNKDVPGQHLYNGACAAALAGQPDVAFERLNRRLALEPNWYVGDPNRDADLAGLHSDPRWQAYCDTIIARRDRIEANYDKPLQQQLIEIGQRDQSIRQTYINALNTNPADQHLLDSLIHEMQAIDSINQVAICKILDTRGFVGRDMVGDACGVYWVIIQHAPVELQKKYFPEFVKAMQHGDLPKSQIAMMDDRIAMFEERPQKYGSQIVENEKGERVIYRLLDPDKVDQWRQEMDLPPLDDYRKMMGIKP